MYVEDLTVYAPNRMVMVMMENEVPVDLMDPNAECWL